MSLWFIFGLIIGFIICLIYNWITDKINLLKLGYNGSSWLLKYIYNKYFKK